MQKIVKKWLDKYITPKRVRNETTIVRGNLPHILEFGNIEILMIRTYKGQGVARRTLIVKTPNITIGHRVRDSLLPQQTPPDRCYSNGHYCLFDDQTTSLFNTNLYLWERKLYATPTDRKYYGGALFLVTHLGRALSHEFLECELDNLRYFNYADSD